MCIYYRDIIWKSSQKNKTEPYLMLFPFLPLHNRVHFSSTNTSFSLLRDFHLVINLSRIAERLNMCCFSSNQGLGVIGRSFTLNKAANFPLYVFYFNNNNYASEISFALFNATSNITTNLCVCCATHYLWKKIPDYFSSFVSILPPVCVQTALS